MRTPPVVVVSTLHGARQSARTIRSDCQQSNHLPAIVISRTSQAHSGQTSRQTRPAVAHHQRVIRSEGGATENGKSPKQRLVCNYLFVECHGGAAAERHYRPAREAVEISLQAHAEYSGLRISLRLYPQEVQVVREEASNPHSVAVLVELLHRANFRPPLWVLLDRLECRKDVSRRSAQHPPCPEAIEVEVHTASLVSRQPVLNLRAPMTHVDRGNTRGGAADVRHSPRPTGFITISRHDLDRATGRDSNRFHGMENAPWTRDWATRT